MKSVIYLITTAFGLLGLLTPNYSTATTADSRYTDSPYFEIYGEPQPGVAQTTSNGGFVLESTKVDGQISGVIADVTVTQIYYNRFNHQIAANYVFPGSTRAAVHGLTIQIGDRVLNAKIEEKMKARDLYQQAKLQNKTASLLEQKRPNVFQMQVANIKAGERIEVTLKYTEHLVPTERVYEFAYPTVVAPRYSNNYSSESWLANPYLSDGKTNKGSAFHIELSLAAGMPLHGIRCNTHEINVQYTSKEKALIKVSDDPYLSGNRDYILRYRLADKKIQAGLMLHQDDSTDENYFLMTVQPPHRSQATKVLPREYIFVVDISGSMKGYPLDTAKMLMRDLIKDLGKQDRFNILAFAGGQHLYQTNSLPATEQNIDKGIRWMNRQSGSGGTEMVKALNRAMQLPSPNGEETSRIMVVVTDGLVSFEREAFDLVRNSLNQTNLFAFGIGDTMNRHLIEGIALAGRGEAFVVTDNQRAKLEADRFREYISAPILTGIDIDYDGLDLYDISPKTIPDIFADRPVTIFGKWKGTKPQGSISITGQGVNGPITIKQPFLARNTTKASALPYLWARQKIRELDDFSGGRTPDHSHKDQIIDLGLKHNLLTRYTSFIAVDNSQDHLPLDQLSESTAQPTGKPTASYTPTSVVAFNTPSGGSTPGPGIIPLIIAGLASLLGKRFLKRNQQ